MSPRSGAKDQSDLGGKVASVLTVSDALFFKNLVLSPHLKGWGSVVGIPLMPFLSAFVVDSARWLGDAGATLDSLDSHKQLLTASRQHLKILEDRGRPDWEKITQRAEQVASIQQGWFKGTHSGRLKLLKNLIQPDLGLTFVGDHLFSTTDLALMSAGITPDFYREQGLNSSNLGMFLGATAEEVGEYLQKVIEMILPEGEPEIRRKVEDLPPLRYRDGKSDRFYRGLVTNSSRRNRAVEILFTWILGPINTAQFIVPVVGQGNPIACFKMRFVCLYHAANTMSHLLELHRQGSILRPSAAGAFSGITTQTPLRSVLSERKLRNVLMHYRIQGSAASLLTESRPLLGLVEAHSPGKTLDSMRLDVDHGLIIASDILRTLLPRWVRPTNDFD